MPLLRTWKANLVLTLVILLCAGAFLALAGGLRLPLGTFGVSMLSDPQGRPYMVIDHPSTHGWLLGYDARHHRVEAWSGTILVQ